jgi:hypothetical protein
MQALIVRKDSISSLLRMSILLAYQRAAASSRICDRIADLVG